MANTDNNSVNVMTELEIAKAAMAVGWVKFSYTKADGSLRIAVGTTNRTLIEQVRGTRLPEYRENKSYYSIGGYFDLTRCDWRQYNPSRFGHLLFDGNMNNETAVTTAFAILAVLEPTDLSAVDCLRYHSTHIVSVAFIDAVIVSVRSNATSYANRCHYEPIALVEKVVAVTAKVVPCACIVASVSAEKPKVDNRSALIAELEELRKRESEILRILLY